MFFSQASNQLKLISLAVIASCLPIAVSAQIAPDGTTSTEVTTERNETTIDRGDRVGDNLFHSFDEFSVPTGGSASFNNAASITNIFSRVTGGNVSSIDGLLSANGTANLFLVNPNGIIFGENARLNVGSSFFATSADSLQFDGDAEFSASNPSAAPLLEVSIPVGLSFRDNPGNIAVNGSLLEVPKGESLSLIGGNIEIIGGENGSIFAIAGKVSFGGLTETGTVEIVAPEDMEGLASSSLSFPDAVARGDVTLGDFAFVSVAGSDGGDIAIDARNITLAGGATGEVEISSGIVEQGSESALGGDIILNATDTVSIVAGNIFNRVLTNTTGNGGETIINAANLNIENGVISNTLFGSGSTGRIIVNVTDNISLTRFGTIASEIGETGVGNSGAVEINSNSLEITNRSFIGSRNAGEGNAGGIEIDTGDLMFNGSSEISSQVFEFAMGDAGNISISADRFNISQQSTLTSNTAGAGNGGNIEVNAANSVLFESGGEITSQSLATASGTGGNVTINTPSLTMGSGNFISTTTLGTGDAGNIEINSTDINLNLNASLFSESESQGRSGSIDINTVTLSLQSEPNRNSPLISAVSFGEGDANNINIQASERIEINGGIVTTQAANFSEFNIIDGIGSTNIIRGTGNGGNINISTSSLSLTNGGEISTSTFSTGNAGEIAIEATDGILLSNSGIFSGVGNLGSGDAGAIALSSSSLILRDRAEISARTEGNGNASNVTLDILNEVSLDRGFVRSISTPLSIGNAGDVRIDTQNLKIRNQGEVSSSNLGEGNGGGVFVVADSVALNNGEISAANEPVLVEGDELLGGEVNLEIADIVILENGSLISARAGNGASGGNIDLNTDIVLAFSNSNSDIVANAEIGRGGNINLTSEALFGIEERPLNSFSNDINASSEFGLDGGITINTPNVDPTSGLLELPAAVGDASDRISQNPCQQGIGSKFIITGKGGFPANPHESLTNNGVEVGLVKLNDLTDSSNAIREEEDSLTTKAKSTPARGWIFNQQGKVTLTAHNRNNREVNRDRQQLITLCSIEN